MTILALDTSSRAASCAILAGGLLRGEFYLSDGPQHSRTILPMVRDLLASAQLSPGDVDRFAVSVGPGSFTGLRIGIAAVKGMAMEPARLCAGISTLEALARNLQGFAGHIVPVMDARREQVYTALFADGNGRMRRLSPDEAISIEKLGARLQGLQGPVTLVGDGARLCLERLGRTDLRIAPKPLLYQRASSVAMAAWELGECAWVAAEELSPIYLRLPQAERELAEKQQGNR